MNKAYCIWLIRAFSQKIGFWGLLGLLLLVGSIVFYWLCIPMMQADIAQASAARLTRDQAQQAQAEKEARNPAKQDAKAVAQFYQQFPQLTAMPSILGELHQLAKAHRLTLEIGDYQYKRAKQKRGETTQVLTRYKMIFPVEGRYTDIRQFIDAALIARPEMALLDLEIVREAREVPDVMVRIVFAVFVKEAS